MKKIGLIIQGPLVSVGKDGRRAHIQKTTLGEAGFIQYDCRENITRVIRDFCDLFEVVVISTWDSEREARDVWEGAAVVSLPDPGEIQREVYTVRSRNKYRQFIGIRHGLIELQKLASVDYVVRIRTDQYLDLRALVASLQESVREHGEDSRLYVPFTRPDDFFVHDIYLAASVQTMRDFLDATIAFDCYEFISCVHRDMILKYAYAKYRDDINVPEWAYFPWWPPCGASKETKKIFSFMFMHVCTPLSSEVFRSVFWRGSALSEQHVDAQYLYVAPTQVRAKKNILDVPALMSINWKRYFKFLAETKQRICSFTDLLQIAVGEVLWKYWNPLRDLAKQTRITALIYRLFR
jgi:hypothetical protein